MALPTVAQGLARLLSTHKSLAPVVNSLSAREWAQKAADAPPATDDSLAKIRDEVLSTYDDHRVGHLITQYTLQRDNQMAKLSALGKEAILSLVAQGALPAEIATAIGVSYDMFSEFVNITCTPEETKRAEELGADSLIAGGIRDLEVAIDKDDIGKAKALLEIKMKLAKTMNKRYVEPKSTTAVQVNNYNDAPSEGPSVPFLQILEPREEDIPPLKPHDAEAEATVIRDHDIPTEYTLYEPMPDDDS